MRPVVLSSEDEGEETELSSITVSSVVTSGRLSDASTISSDSIWDKLSDWEPYIDKMDSITHPTCVPPLYDSRRADPSIKDKRKFYNVYVGDLVGCYREWYVCCSNNFLSSDLHYVRRGDAGGRVTGIPGNLHKSYTTWELALEAWQQNCRAYHRHAPGFVHGSTFEPDALISPPEPVTPRRSQHNVVFPSSPSSGQSSSAVPPGTPSRSSRTRTRSKGNSKGNSSSIVSSNSSPPAPIHCRRAWAVHGTKDNKSVVTT